MGIGDTKIGKNELDSFARGVIAKGNFTRFAKSFSNDTRNGLDGISKRRDAQSKADDYTK